MAGIRLRCIWLEITILIVLTTACASTSLAPPTRETPLHTAGAIPTATHTLISPTLTPSPTMPPTTTPTLTPTYTPTPTHQPTLNPTQIVLRVEELLKTNGNCKQPCLWGLTVGKTYYEEVDGFFQNLGRKGYTENNAKGEIIHYDTGFRVMDAIPIQIALEFKSGIIQEMSMFVGSLSDPKVSREDWPAYSLKSMLQAYGIPSKVGFAVQQPTEPPFNTGLVAYSFVVHFEGPNATYFYRGGPIRGGKYYQVCPMSPKESVSYLWLFFGKHPYGDFRQLVDLSEATSISLEDFYKLFTEGDEQACLNLNAKAFQEK